MKMKSYQDINYSQSWFKHLKGITKLKDLKIGFDEEDDLKVCFDDQKDNHFKLLLRSFDFSWHQTIPISEVSSKILKIIQNVIVTEENAQKEEEEWEKRDLEPEIVKQIERLQADLKKIRQKQFTVFQK